MAEPRGDPAPVPTASAASGSRSPDGGASDVRSQGGGAPVARWLDEAPVAARLDRVLREPDYRVRLSAEVDDLFRLEALLRRGVRGEVTRRFCHRLAETAERVEYGLLEVGARGNATYAFLTEVVSAVRWASRAVHALLHLRGRIHRYLGDRTDLGAFRADLDGAIAWLAGRLVLLLAAAREEATGPLSLSVPDEAFDAGLLRGEDVRWRLPQDLDAAASVDERERIADLATAFLGLCDEFAGVGCPVAEERTLLVEFVKSHFSLSAAHSARVRMHAIQSTYDTAVAATPLEAADPELKTFRGYVSILLHLLEATAYLLQLHARLEEDVRSAEVRERVNRIVEDRELLRWAVRFGVHNAVACCHEGRTTAQAVLDRYTRIREATLDLPPGRKLHLRPAGLIVRVVLRHGLPVTMSMGDQSVDARQLMDVILLAASHPEATQVGFRGDEKPLSDLADLFRHRLGEDGMEGFPPSLSWLREGGKPPATSV